MTKIMKIVLIVLLVVVLAVVGVGVYVLTSMRADAVEIVEKPTNLDATGEPETITIESGEPTPTPMPIYQEDVKAENVVNILLIGTDSRNVNEENSDGRSDSMMLASLNKENNTLTLISFMRDSRVWRVGKKGNFSFQNKLNGAYRGGYGGGGAGELINTLNYNYGLDIQQYVAIGFDGFAALIDKIGGLDVPLDQAEINFINDRITGNHILEPDIVKNANTVKAEPGIVHLDGAQCLIYARNRHTGADGGSGNDFDRVNRQQEIINLVYQKISAQMNEQSVLALISFASNYITTNLSLETMSDLAKLMLTTDIEFKSETIPSAGKFSYYKDPDNGEKTDQLEFDIEEAATYLQTLIYGAPVSATPTPEQ